MRNAGFFTNQQSNEKSGATLTVSAAFSSLFCIVGLALWGLPFYYDFFIRDFGWTRAEVTSGNAISKLIVGPVFGFLAGWLVDRFGPKRLMMAGILMAAGALVGLGGASTLTWFYFFYLMNALGYVCGGPLPSQVLISRVFVESRGKAMGLAYLGIGFGGAFAPWISHYLAVKFGWQMALRLIGGLIIAVALPFVALLKEALPPKDKDEKSAATEVKKAFKTPSFVLLIVGSMCSIAAVSGTQQNLKLFLSLDRQYSQASAAQILSLVLSFSIIGRIVIGWMADRFPKKYVMLLIYLLVAAVTPVLFLGEQRAVIAIAAALFGIGLGGDYMIIPLITAEIFGVNILGRLMGVLLTAGGIAEALSPWWIAHLRDSTGSYAYSCAALVGMALLGAVAILALPKPRREA